MLYSAQEIHSLYLSCDGLSPCVMPAGVPDDGEGALFPLTSLTSVPPARQVGTRTGIGSGAPPRSRYTAMPPTAAMLTPASSA